MKLIPLLASLLALLPAASFAYDPKAGPQVPLQAGEWWNEPYPTPFDIKQLKQPQAAISVKGNALVNDKGQTVVLRGVNIADPDKLARQGKWDKSLLEAAKTLGSNTIRLPIHPIAWRTRGSADYLKLLDQAVLWANELQLYLIIDWHSMGNLVKEQYFHPMYVTNAQETREFWRTIAFRYSEVPTVAVYELFNEPTHNFGKLG